MATALTHQRSLTQPDLGIMQEVVGNCPFPVLKIYFDTGINLSYARQKPRI